MTLVGFSGQVNNEHDWKNGGSHGIRNIGIDSTDGSAGEIGKTKPQDEADGSIGFGSSRLSFIDGPSIA